MSAVENALNVLNEILSDTNIKLKTILLGKVSTEIVHYEDKKLSSYFLSKGINFDFLKLLLKKRNTKDEGGFVYVYKDLKLFSVSFMKMLLINDKKSFYYSVKNSIEEYDREIFFVPLLVHYYKVNDKGNKYEKIDIYGLIPMFTMNHVF